MARKILLLGHDETTLRQAAAALSSPNTEIATERSADAARERILRGEADLAVIDADMPGGAGLRTASELQRRPGAFPLVLLVARERQEQVNEAQRRSAAPHAAPETVAKPIRAEELREVVSRALGPEPIALTPGPTPVGAPPTSGRLETRPLHVVLGDLARRQAHGRLELESGTYRARIQFADGLVTAAASNDPRTLAGYAEVASGALPRENLERALAHVRSARVPLPRALLDTGAFEPAALAAALARQAVAVVEQACGLSSGTWSFQSGAEAPEGPPARLHALALAANGVRQAYPSPTIRSWLDRHGAERVVAHPELEAHLAAAGIDTVLRDAILSAASAAELVSRLSEADLGLLFTLAGFGLVRFAPPATVAAGHGRQPPVVAPVTTRSGTPLSFAERRAIENEDRRTAEATHYDVLFVPRDADPAAIRAAYYAAAKRWHSDAFAGRQLDDLVQAVERIFARVSEANTVLGDPAKRAEYDVFLERKAQGLPTDVASVLRAEELFHKAQALFRAQRYADAEALFRQAVDLNPAEAEFWAYLGASAHRARGSSALVEAREALARARALIPRSLVTEYLEAQLEIGEGELDAAERRLRKILLDKPDHSEAARDLRTLRERKERETATGRGFLGTLWKRK